MCVCVWYGEGISFGIFFLLCLMLSATSPILVFSSSPFFFGKFYLLCRWRNELFISLCVTALFFLVLFRCVFFVKNHQNASIGSSTTTMTPIFRLQTLTEAEQAEQVDSNSVTPLTQTHAHFLFICLLRLVFATFLSLTLVSEWDSGKGKGRKRQPAARHLPKKNRFRFSVLSGLISVLSCAVCAFIKKILFNCKFISAAVIQHVNVYVFATIALVVDSLHHFLILSLCSLHTPSPVASTLALSLCQINCHSVPFHSVHSLFFAHSAFAVVVTWSWTEAISRANYSRCFTFF